jgi:hypothetical protein
MAKWMLVLSYVWVEAFNGGSQHCPSERERVSRTALERPSREGERPVSENADRRGLRDRSTTGHANPVGSRADHCPRLNTHC